VSQTEPEAGRLEAFHETFRVYFPRLVRYFRSRSFSAAEAEDLSQTALWNVYRAWGNLRAGGSLEAWIYAVARNAAADEGRRRARRRETEPPDENVPAAGVTAEAEHAHREEAGRTVRALRSLPARMRACLLLRVQKELSYREIAFRLGISEVTVKVQIWMARKRLREGLAE
jgi:RNA polymerase sigma-70 factor (ECF subfamily)